LIIHNRISRLCACASGSDASQQPLFITGSEVTPECFTCSA
jgi:hypothetical protein